MIARMQRCVRLYREMWAAGADHGMLRAALVMMWVVAFFALARFVLFFVPGGRP